MKDVKSLILGPWKKGFYRRDFMQLKMFDWFIARFYATRFFRAIKIFFNLLMHRHTHTSSTRDSLRKCKKQMAEHRVEKTFDDSYIR